jgi:hypothetical protein
MVAKPHETETCAPLSECGFPAWMQQSKRHFDFRCLRIGGDVHRFLVVADDAAKLLVVPAAITGLHCISIARVAAAIGGEQALARAAKEEITKPRNHERTKTRKAFSHHRPALHRRSARRFVFSFFRAFVMLLSAICGVPYDRFCTRSPRQLDAECEGTGRETA